MEVIVTSSVAEKLNENVLQEGSKNHLFKLQVFANSFDKQFRELLFLQNNVLRMLNDTIGKIKPKK